MTVSEGSSIEKSLSSFDIIDPPTRRPSGCSVGLVEACPAPLKNDLGGSVAGCQNIPQPRPLLRCQHQPPTGLHGRPRSRIPTPRVGTRRQPLVGGLRPLRSIGGRIHGDQVVLIVQVV